MFGYIHNVSIFIHKQIYHIFLDISKKYPYLSIYKNRWAVIKVDIRIPQPAGDRRGGRCCRWGVNEKGHPPKKRRCPVMSGTTERSSNLLRGRRRLLGLIFWRLQPDLHRKSLVFGQSPRKVEAFMRPAEQGGRGGRCSGGLPPRLMLRHFPLSFRCMSACCDIWCSYTLVVLERYLRMSII